MHVTFLLEPRMKPKPLANVASQKAHHPLLRQR
jgi:hypothetical protein